MNTPPKVKVNPKVLIWAREELGMTLPDAASQIGVEAPLLTRWETDGKHVPFGLLQALARTYKRQTAVFFLPEVPQKVKKPTDYRNVGAVKRHFSPESLLAIRRTNRYLQTARELLDVYHWNRQYEWLKNFDGRQEHIYKEISLLRELLNASLEEQLKQGRSDMAFRYWRGKIEGHLGIFVFQFPMPENELDGFSYTLEKFPCAIVVNNRMAAVRKIFTLFHELSHILKRSPGVCQIDVSNSTRREFNIELECNSFAGNFLVPSNSVKSTHSVDEIFNLAHVFNVSGEVYLRRMLDQKKIDRDTFFGLLDGVRERSSKLPRRKHEGYPSPIIQSKSTRGNKLFNLVNSAVSINSVSYSTASDILGLKIANLRA